MKESARLPQPFAHPPPTYRRDFHCFFILSFTMGRKYITRKYWNKPNPTLLGKLPSLRAGSGALLF